jgi:predicted acylesterase/phospholipase RssA
MGASVFISFASQDREIAETICRAVEKRGLSCWISFRDVRPGEFFATAIVRAITDAKVMVLVFSANANKSDDVKKELILASQNNVVIMPVRLENVTADEVFTYEFTIRQWYDLFPGQSIEPLVEHVVRAVGDELPATDAEGMLRGSPPSRSVSHAKPAISNANVPIMPKTKAHRAKAERARQPTRASTTSTQGDADGSLALTKRINQKGRKKLLAIDGGGIRGVLALEVLIKIEELLKAKSGRPDFRLADYFDYIAGTSTGGIIAAGLSIGMSVQEILAFYQEAGGQMFVKANLLRRLRYKFEDEPLGAQLKQVFEAGTTLGSEKLRTLLLLMMRNASTDSPWPISNNPYAKYNDTARPDCNLNLPLWQLVRASTAAPTYFPPEVIVMGGGSLAGGNAFQFVDGAVTPYNNPAFQMFLMATLDHYWALKPDARWRTGADQMLIVSVGTGTVPAARKDFEREWYGLAPEETNVLFNATTIQSALMFAALNEQDLLCRVFGNCRVGDPIDREVGDLVGNAGPLQHGQKLFTYLRYNAELTREGLDALGCRDIEPEAVQKLDSIDGIPDLRRVGLRVAEIKVLERHFDGFMPS